MGFRSVLALLPPPAQHRSHPAPRLRRMWELFTAESAFSGLNMGHLIFSIGAALLSQTASWHVAGLLASQCGVLLGSCSTICQCSVLPAGAESQSRCHAHRSFCRSRVYYPLVCLAQCTKTSGRQYRQTAQSPTARSWRPAGTSTPATGASPWLSHWAPRLCPPTCQNTKIDGAAAAG